MIKKNFQEYPLFYLNWFVFDFTETLQFLYKSQQFRYFCKKLRIKYRSQKEKRKQNFKPHTTANGWKQIEYGHPFFGAKWSRSTCCDPEKYEVLIGLSFSSSSTSISFWLNLLLPEDQTSRRRRTETLSSSSSSFVFSRKRNPAKKKKLCSILAMMLQVFIFMNRVDK